MDHTNHYEQVAKGPFVITIPMMFVENTTGTNTISA